MRTKTHTHTYTKYTNLAEALPNGPEAEALALRISESLCSHDSRILGVPLPFSHLVEVCVRVYLCLC